ncbi:unnamed protein product [Candidula unifasciata]|uniref:Uncharacterized protein n=1 Tax=Candidula unifasciata TaxID=100452 RepID=A0A8S3YKA9_9EUPU|nr:unnamed protein product [Candidula unifasciata]
MALTEFFPPVGCRDGVPSLVYVTGDTIKVNHSKTSLVTGSSNRFKECRYRSIAKKPGTDFDTVVLYNSTWFNDSINLRDNDDNLVVECYGSDNSILSRSYHSLIRVKKDLEMKLKKRLQKHIAKNSPAEIFNVLMIGIEGNSKQNLQRHMPKTRNYLLKVLNAIELKKYNKIGDHTYPNVIPILTGKTEEEFLHQNWNWSGLFDDINHQFVWSDLSNAGYRTGLFLDTTNKTAFHFFKRAWDKPPVDYYYRATLLDLERDPLVRYKVPNCVGDTPEVTYNFNFWTQMASTFTNPKTHPYFGYSFYNHLTHSNSNGASAGDDLYLRIFLELKQRNIINNTIVIFFSDHGARVGKIRHTYNGVIESMMPHVFLILPPWFRRKYPDVYRVLELNQERLTTNKDLYMTLQVVLNFQGKPGIGNIKQKGISLFNEIPRERTCDDAGIPFEFCVCNKLVKANVSADLTVSLATEVTNRLWYYYDRHVNICNRLTLKYVHSVWEIHLDHEENTRGKSMYQIIISTTPNDALYEAKLVFDNSTKIITVVGDVIRLNMYRGQDNCMNNPKLKPFCHCRG